MTNDTDRAYQKKLIQSLSRCLTMNGAHIQLINGVMVEAITGQALKLRRVRRDLVKYQKENDLSGIAVSREIIDDLEQSIIDIAARYFVQKIPSRHDVN
ncbi:hypothetical protein [Endozoicomonas acroporae]|uniref:hypothetical protein n=1 Tax=Endozoicomonas acroporae TaxID=1701104 RepID=UPI0013D3549D|nr:hypothetical protein [Endozoicomonas acroporae]